MVAELASVRSFIEALKSGDSSYLKFNPNKPLASVLSRLKMGVEE